jgi:hypothetical protein
MPTTIQVLEGTAKVLTTVVESLVQCNVPEVVPKVMEKLASACSPMLMIVCLVAPPLEFALTSAA